MNTLKKRMITAAVVLIMLVTPVSAAELMDSTLVKGLQKLIADATFVLTILCPSVGGLAAVACWMAKGPAPQEDWPMWNKRIKTALIAGAGGSVISGVISLLASYFA